MTDSPKISVIIPTFNCSKYLPEAINSVLNQTYQNLEMIVVDDGSTDTTREIINSYINRYPKKIKYIFQENKGLACARNTGVKNALGEYIALLDADDIWTVQRLKETLGAIEKEPDIGLVHANINWMSEEGNIISSPKRKTRYLSGYIFENIFLRKAHIAIPTILVRKECFDKVGGFDENLTRLGCEDREMWLRIAELYKFAYIDKVLGYYRIRKGSMSKDLKKMLEARYYVVNKFCPKNGTYKLLRKKALAKIHRDLGDDLLFKHDFNESKKEYLSALCLWPFSIVGWINLTRALLKIRVKNVL